MKNPTGTRHQIRSSPFTYTPSRLTPTTKRNNIPESISTEYLLRVKETKKELAPSDSAEDPVIKDLTTIEDLVNVLDTNLKESSGKTVLYHPGSYIPEEYYDFSGLQAALKKVEGFMEKLYSSVPLKKQIATEKFDPKLMLKISSRFETVLKKLRQCAELHSAAAETQKEIEQDPEAHTTLQRVRGRAQNIIIDLVKIIDPKEAVRTEIAFNSKLSKSERPKTIGHDKSTPTPTITRILPKTSHPLRATTTPTSHSTITSIEQLLREVLENKPYVNLQEKVEQLRRMKEQTLEAAQQATSYNIALIRLAFHSAINYLSQGKASEGKEVIQYRTMEGLITLKNDPKRLRGIHQLGQKILETSFTTEEPLITSVNTITHEVKTPKAKPVTKQTPAGNALTPHAKQEINRIQELLNQFQVSTSTIRNESLMSHLKAKLSELIDYTIEASPKNRDAILMMLPSTFSLITQPKALTPIVAFIRKALTLTHQAIASIGNNSADTQKAKLALSSLRTPGELRNLTMIEIKPQAAKNELTETLGRIKNYFTNTINDKLPRIKDLKDYTETRLARLEKLFQTLKTFINNKVASHEDTHLTLYSFFKDFGEKLAKLEEDQITDFDISKLRRLLSILLAPFSPKTKIYTKGNHKLEKLNQEPIIAELRSPTNMTRTGNKKVEALLQDLNSILNPTKINDDTVKELQATLTALLSKLKNSRGDWLKVFEGLFSRISTLAQSVSIPNFTQAKSLRYLKHALFQTVEIVKPKTTNAA